MSSFVPRGTAGGSEVGSLIHTIWRRGRGPAQAGDSARRDCLARLEAAGLSQRLPQWARREFLSLQQEPDLEMLGESLLALGRRLSQASEDEAAVQIFSAVGEISTLPGTAERAREEIDALSGRGSASRRFEFLSSRVARDSANPIAIAGMVAGTSLFSLARTAMLSRLLASPASGFLTRGFGARALASTGAFFLEAPAFWGTTKLLNEAFHPGRQAWDLSTNLREILGSGITLGAIKLARFGTTGLYRAKGPYQGVLHQGGMVTALYLGHQLEEAVGLRLRHDDATTLVDSLAMWLQFTVAGRLGRGILGESWLGMEQELNLRASRLARFPGDGNFSGENSVRLQALTRPARSAVPIGGGPSPSRPFETQLRPLQMAMHDPFRGGSGSRLSAKDFVDRALRDSRTEDLKNLKDLMVQIYCEATKRPLHEKWERYHRSADPEDWKSLIAMIKAAIAGREELGDILERDAALAEFRADWESRPHFTNPEQVPFLTAKGTPKSHQMVQALSELRKGLSRTPDRSAWREFSLRQTVLLKKEPNKIFQMSEVETPEGIAYAGNWRHWGMVLRFDSRGYFLPPIEMGPPFDEVALRERVERLKNPPAVAIAPLPTPASASIALPLYPRGQALEPQPGEKGDSYALRILAESTQGAASNLAIARSLIDSLRDPNRETLIRQAVERMAGRTRALLEGSGMMVRKYSLPGLIEPITIVSLPSTFLPEQWSLGFAEGVLQEFQRTGQRFHRAMELGSGTGWMSIILAKTGMAQEVLALDKNPHAVVVGELNALLNGVTEVRFLESDLYSAVPEGYRADLILACLSQLPSEQPIEDLRALADLYPSQNRAMDRYGLGLVDRAVEGATARLNDSGKLLFNLGGRPGRRVLEEMMERRGFHPTIRAERTISQDTRNDLFPFVRLEERFGHRFEFFLKDETAPRSAREVIGQKDVRHRLYLMEGRPYATQLKNELAGVLGKVRRWGYTEHPGSENEALREELSRELSRQWGLTFAPETLFIAPGAEGFIEAWLKVVLPPQGRLLLAGDASSRMGSILEGLERVTTVKLGAADLREVTAQLRREGGHAVILELPRDQEFSREDLLDFFRATLDPKPFVLLVEPFPRRGGERIHAVADILMQSLPALETTTILQPLSESYNTPALPLSVGIVANSALYERLVRYGETAYSRVSLPIQEAYRDFLWKLENERTQVPESSGSIYSLASVFHPRSDQLKVLDSSSAFDSRPNATHPDPIDMSFGESEWALPVNLQQVHAEAFRTSYPDLEARAREAVAAYLRQSRGARYRPEQIILGAGVQPLLGSAVRAIRAVHPGRPTEVFVPVPSYAVFFPTVELAGAKLREVNTGSHQGFLVDAASLSPSWKISPVPRPQRALLLNQPANPAGRFYSEADWRNLLDLVKSGDDYLFLDDVYGLSRFNSHRTPARHYSAIAQERLRHRLVLFGGLSKEFAGGGWRFGFAASEHPDLLKVMDSRAVYRPDPVALAAASEILPRWERLVSQHNGYLAHRMLQLSELFRSKNIPFIEAEGGYALFVNLGSLFGRNYSASGKAPVTVSSKNFHELLMSEAGIQIHSDRWSRVPGWNRFVFSIERIDEAISRLRKFFRHLR